MKLQILFNQAKEILEIQIVLFHFVYFFCYLSFSYIIFKVIQWIVISKTQTLIILQMSTATEGASISTDEKQSSKHQKTIENPRKAATKLKDVHNNLQMMKRRFKVLQVQDDYHRYRTIDQEKRISHHQQIHQHLLKDREELKKSLQKIKDSSELKEQTDQIRQQLKQKIKQARKQLLDERTDRYNQIGQLFVQNTLAIKDNKEKDILTNRQKTVSVKMQQQQKRESISRHMQEKVRSIKLNKSIDSSALSRKAEQGQQQLSRLMQYQQQLIKKSSQSLQASQLMKHKFNQVFASSINGSRLLPQIRAKTNNSKYTNSSTQV